MRANSVLAKLAKTKNECSIWLVYTIAISIISAYHEPWFDEYHVWFMCEKMKLTWLWSAMTREGHFMLWHLLIYPFVKLGCSFWCLQFVGVCLASIAAFILTFKAPFNLFTKVLILFSYPILFQFFVIARCYALIPAILFVIAWLHKAQNKHKFLYCFFIGLLAHTHAYMEGMVGGLFLLYCWDHIYKPYKKNINIKSSIYGALITIGVVFMAFIQVSGSLKFAQENITNKTNSILEVIESICLFRTTNYNFIIPGNWHQLFPDIIQYHPFIYIAYFSLWSIILFLLYFILWKEKENRKYMYLYLIAIAWQIYMAIAVYGFGLQRIFLPFLILIFILWISWKKEVRYHITLIIACLFLMTAGYRVILKDIKESFSNDISLYNYIENTINHKYPLYISDCTIKYRDIYDNYEKIIEQSPDPIFPSETKLLDVMNKFNNCEQYYLFTKNPLNTKYRLINTKLISDTLNCKIYRISRNKNTNCSHQKE